MCETVADNSNKKNQGQPQRLFSDKRKKGDQLAVSSQYKLTRNMTRIKKNGQISQSSLAQCGRVTRSKNGGIVVGSDGVARVAATVSCRSHYCAICSKKLAIDVEKKATWMMQNAKRLGLNCYFLTLSQSSRSSKKLGFGELYEMHKKARAMVSNALSKCMVGVDCRSTSTVVGVDSSGRLNVHSHVLVVAGGVAGGVDVVASCIRDKWRRWWSGHGVAAGHGVDIAKICMTKKSIKKIASYYARQQYQQTKTMILARPMHYRQVVKWAALQSRVVSFLFSYCATSAIKSEISKLVVQDRIEAKAQRIRVDRGGVFVGLDAHVIDQIFRSDSMDLVLSVASDVYKRESGSSKAKIKSLIRYGVKSMLFKRGRVQ